MEIRFSRHAKNKLRLYKLAREDIAEAIDAGQRLNQGDKLESRLGNLRVIWVLIGSYAFVVTVIRIG
jgi:hypothetical protein